MSSKKDRVGEIHITKEQYTVKIIEYINNKNCTIQLEDGNIYKNRHYNDILCGELKNPYHPSICDVGYLGTGKYKSSINRIGTREYTTWKDMIHRCYSEKMHKNNPTYIGCSVDEEWHNFQNFAKWYDEKYINDFCLDKDILLKNNKIYSPETCCFVPQEINNTFTFTKSTNSGLPIGVKISKGYISAQMKVNSEQKHLGYFKTVEEAHKAYKIGKKNQIIKVAEDWRGRIGEDVYYAMINYNI